MKRALIPAFDPLPRSLSTKGLLGLVGVVVLGTTVTVVRYLDSSKSPAHRNGGHSLFERPSEVRAAPRESSDGALRSRPSGSEYGAATPMRSGTWGKGGESCGSTSCPRTLHDAESPVRAIAPSVFRPEDLSPGS